MKSEAIMRANANAAVRALTNRIYRNFKKKFGEGWDLPAKDISWMNVDDPEYALGTIGIYRPDHPEADCAMEMARTVGANAVFQCHHGLIAVMADHLLLSYAMNVHEGRFEGNDSEALVELRHMASQMHCCFGTDELARMRETVDLATVRYLARSSFAEDARTRLEMVLNPKPQYRDRVTSEEALARAGGGTPHWLFLSTLLSTLTGEPNPRRKLDEHREHPTVKNVAARHDDFLLQLRSADGMAQQHLWSDVIRNSEQAALLLLFGIREVDWIIPSFEPVAVSAAVHTQLRAAWGAMSALLHIDIPDYQGAIANINKAVEDELLQTYFEPFFSAHPATDEPHDRERFGRLYQYGKSWPRQKPTLGEMIHLLELPASIQGSNTSLLGLPAYVQVWIVYLLVMRAATARPSLAASLKEFKSLRNPGTHGGHPPTERDISLIARARAWTIIKHVALERSNDFETWSRRAVRARELGLPIPPEPTTYDEPTSGD